MSYEGYVQYLCKNGHNWEQDCYVDDFEAGSDKCPHCQQKAVWRNDVDTTNGSFEGGKRIDGYVDLEVKMILRCTKCGSRVETIYKIPRRKRNGKK